MPRVGYRVADGSSLTFRTDLPPSSRNVHPSGVLHAFRSSRSDGENGSDNDAPDADATGGGTNEVHAFVWVENALHIEAALSLLEGRGFRRSESIVFVPYSSRRNWLRRYPHAAPALVCGEDGKCVVRPLAVAETNDEGDGDVGVKVKEEEKGIADDYVDAVDAAAAADAAEKRAREKYEGRAFMNMFKNRKFIPDAERDELHVEIYNYLTWLHAKVVDLEERAKAAALEKKVASMIPSGEVDSDDGGGSGKKKRKWSRSLKGACVNLADLQGVIDKMESAFLIIPHVKDEAAAEIAAAEAAVAAEETRQEQQGEEQERSDEEGASEEQRWCNEQQEGGLEREEKKAASGDRPRNNGVDGEQRKIQASPGAMATNRLPNIESPPFLERHCSEALFQKVLARERSGKRRRSRRRKRPCEDEATRSYKVERFDEMFDKLLRYREEHGHVAVQRNRRRKDWKNDENKKLAGWVNRIRERRRTLLRTSGLDHEPDVPGKHSQLTLERVQRLDSVGFVWSVAGPKTKVPWEDRFQEAVEYFEGHGRWPPHALGKLGQWVHRQRELYTREDANFMRDKAPKLDEVGFEWAPRGPRRRR